MFLVQVLHGKHVLAEGIFQSIDDGLQVLLDHCDKCFPSIDLLAQVNPL